jgi:hypothetical protein
MTKVRPLGRMVRAQSGGAAARRVRPGLRSLRSPAAAEATGGPFAGVAGTMPRPASGGSRVVAPARKGPRVACPRAAWPRGPRLRRFELNPDRPRAGRQQRDGKQLPVFRPPFFVPLPGKSSLLPPVWRRPGAAASLFPPREHGGPPVRRRSAVQTLRRLQLRPQLAPRPSPPRATARGPTLNGVPYDQSPFVQRVDLNQPAPPPPRKSVRRGADRCRRRCGGWRFRLAVQALRLAAAPRRPLVDR